MINTNLAYESIFMIFKRNSYHRIGKLIAIKDKIGADFVTFDDILWNKLWTVDLIKDIFRAMPCKECRLLNRYISTCILLFQTILCCSSLRVIVIFW